MLMCVLIKQHKSQPLIQDDRPSRHTPQHPKPPEESVVKQLGRKRKFNAVDAFEENFVEVHFTEDSAGGLETLLKLYQFGVINFDRFSSCALRIAGMDQDNTLPQGV